MSDEKFYHASNSRNITCEKSGLTEPTWVRLYIYEDTIQTLEGENVEIDIDEIMYDKDYGNDICKVIEKKVYVFKVIDSYFFDPICSIPELTLSEDEYNSLEFPTDDQRTTYFLHKMGCVILF